MADEKTLQDALLKESFNKGIAGNVQEQIGVLSEEAKNLTKDKIISILNSESHDLSQESITSLRMLARIRIRNGQRLLPWEDLTGLTIPKSGNVYNILGW